MPDSLSGKLHKISSHFSKWDKVLSEYIKSYYSIDHIDQEKYRNVVLELHEILNKMLSVFIEIGKFKDQLGLPAKIEIFPTFGQAAVVTSQKMGTEFSLGIDDDSFFLQTYIYHPWHLKKMKEDFWIEFTSLCSLGDFQFVENAGLASEEGKQAEKIFKNAKSSVFQLIRNVILLELYDSNSLIDLGWLEIRWPFNKINWEVLIRNGSLAFKKLYKLNYMLYRAEYISKRKI